MTGRDEPSWSGHSDLAICFYIINFLAQRHEQQASAQQGDPGEQQRQEATGNPIDGTHDATPYKNQAVDDANQLIKSFGIVKIGVLRLPERSLFPCSVSNMPQFRFLI
jgi:hypothetical protein